jgi:hypothetical protein
METNHLQKLLSRMRHQSQVVAAAAAAAAAAETVEQNSIEDLSRCQYLRQYDWDARDARRQGERAGCGEQAVERVSSWAAAENSLKAGFLKLHLKPY